MRLRAYRRGIEQNLCAHKGHDPGGFGVPLIPTDADAEAADPGVPDAETRIAGAEIVLFLIAGPVGDMALAIDAEGRAAGIDHH